MASTSTGTNSSKSSVPASLKNAPPGAIGSVPGGGYLIPNKAAPGGASVIMPGQNMSTPPKSLIGGRSGGGGGSSSSAGTVSAPISIAPQKASQQAQDTAKTLATQNTLTAANAIQRDQNYAFSKSSGAVVYPGYGSSSYSSFKNSYPTTALLELYNQPDYRQVSSGTKISNPFFGDKKVSPSQMAFSVDILSGVPTEYAGLNIGTKQAIASSKAFAEVQSSIQNRINTGALPYSTDEERKSTEQIAMKEFTSQVEASNKYFATTGFSKDIAYTPPPISQRLQTGAELVVPAALTVGALAIGQPELALFAGDISSAYFITKGVAKGDVPTIAGGLAMGVGQFGAEGYYLTKQALGQTAFKVSTPQFIKAEGGDVYAQVFAERIIPSGEAKQTVDYTMLLTKSTKGDVFGTAESGSNVLLKSGTETFFGQTTGGFGKTRTVLMNAPFPTIDVTKPLSAGFQASALEIGGASYGSKSLRIELPETMGSAGSFYTKGKEAGFKTTPFYSLSKETPEGLSVMGGKPSKLSLGFENIKLKGSVEYYGKILSTDLEPVTTGGFGETTQTFYHSTSSKNVPSILEKGLIPSAKSGVYQGKVKPLSFVSTGTSAEATKGFGLRSVIQQGGEVKTLKISIPESKMSGLLASSEKLSGVNEFRFKEVPKEYISVLELKGFELPKAQRATFEVASGLITKQAGRESLSMTGARGLTGFQGVSSLSVGSSSLTSGLKQSSFSFNTQTLQPQTGYKFASVTVSGLSSGLGTVSLVKPSFVSPSASSLKSLELQSQAQAYKQVSPLQNPTKTMAAGFGFGFAPALGFGGGLDMPSLGGFALPKPKNRGRKASYDIAPSFTAIVENIKMTSPLKISSKVGVTPFQTRGLLVTKKGKPGKGPYFRFTDL